MSDTTWHENATKTARILQIIVGALVMGVSVFLAIALNLAPMVKPPASILPIPFLWLAAALVVAGLIARAVVLGSVTAKARREIVNGTYSPIAAKQGISSLPAEESECRDAKYLLSAYQTRTIISAALVEGWGFFAAIAYLIEGDPLSLGLAVLLVLGIALHFPTRSRVIGWVERQLEAVERERMLR